MKRNILCISILSMCLFLTACHEKEQTLVDLDNGEQGITESKIDENNVEEESVPVAHYLSTNDQGMWFGYDKENACHWLLFGFREGPRSKSIAQDATIHISIVNKKGEEVYRKDHDVTSQDYSEWQFDWGLYPVELLGTILIYDEEIMQGSWSEGTLSISADTSHGMHFKGSSMPIANLPIKPLQVMVNLPTTVKYYNYYTGKLENVIEITDATFFYMDEISGKGGADITIKMVENKKDKKPPYEFGFRYIIKNSAGKTLNEGYWFTQAVLADGESTVISIPLTLHMNLNESYILEFQDKK